LIWKQVGVVDVRIMRFRFRRVCWVGAGQGRVSLGWGHDWLRCSFWAGVFVWLEKHGDFIRGFLFFCHRMCICMNETLRVTTYFTGLAARVLGEGERWVSVSEGEMAIAGASEVRWSVEMGLMMDLDWRRRIWKGAKEVSSKIWSIYCVGSAAKTLEIWIGFGYGNNLSSFFWLFRRVLIRASSDD